MEIIGIALITYSILGGIWLINDARYRKRKKKREQDFHEKYIDWLVMVNTMTPEEIEKQFRGCTSLTTIDTSNWDVSSASSIADIFKEVEIGKK